MLNVIRKFTVVGMLAATVITSPAIAFGQSYLSRDQQSFLSSVNDYLKQQNNRISYLISDSDKVISGQNRCKLLDRGEKLSKLVLDYGKDLANRTDLNEEMKFKLLQYEVTINLSAIAFFCPKYKDQIPPYDPKS